MTDSQLKGTLGVTEHLNVNGDVSVLGGVRLLGDDVAEQFESVDDSEIDPGSVVVATGADSVQVCSDPYDHRVACVVSDVGGFRPAVLLNDQGRGNHLPVALAGRVRCKIDAQSAPGRSGRHAHHVRYAGACHASLRCSARGWRSDRPGTRPRCGMVPVLVALQ